MSDANTEPAGREDGGAANTPPPWWGWPRGWRGYGTEFPGAIGPNGFRLEATTDALANRGIRERDRVWVNPDKPAQPDEVVYARLADGRCVLAVWRWIHEDREYLEWDGLPPWLREPVGDPATGGRQRAPSHDVRGEPFAILGPAVFVETTTRRGEPVPGHAPLPVLWAGPWGRDVPAWVYSGETSARVEMAGPDGYPYVLGLGRGEQQRLYLPAADQGGARGVVEAHRLRAYAELQALTGEPAP